jgi:hypothetical protein
MPAVMMANIHAAEYRMPGDIFTSACPGIVIAQNRFG